MTNKSSNLQVDMNPGKHSSAMAVLPMRFYANWDVDRTSSPIAVQRVLSMVFTRLCFTKSLAISEHIPFTIAIRLQNNKRTLRTNDLSISSSKLDIPLDISFIIQYCHFIKRKPNILQILIQRRKRYKNRQIPGFKTLAMGHLNLDEILQFGGSREVIIWDTTCLQQKVRHSMRELHAGKIEITNCYTKPAESSIEPCGGASGRQRVVATINEKEPMVLSEEEPEEFSSADESGESDMEFTPRTATNGHHGTTAEYFGRRQKNFLKQRNIKQKVIALLRKFKPDEAMTAEEEGPHTSGSIVQPTELELQEIFEELENISDSGPEIEDDKLSIVSNPRPKIRPFFGSKSDIMPPIMDLQNEDGLFLSDELSADSEVVSSAEERTPINNNKPDEAEGVVPRKGSIRSNQQQCIRNLLKHSDTANSIVSHDAANRGGRGNESMEELLSRLCLLSSTHIIPEHIWICSSADLPWISKVNNKLLDPICLLDCPSSVSVRALMQAIIWRIQNFCNNNSISPPTITIGVLGGDILLANVLKSYVVLLQDKACKEDWLNYLRFSLVLPPHTAVGRLLSQVAGFGGYSEAIWKILSHVSTLFKESSNSAGIAEHVEIRNCLASITKEQDTQRYTNLHIGEVMLQLTKPSDHLTVPISIEAESRSQAFVPFLAELLTGSSVCSEHPSSSSSVPDPTFSSLHYIGRVADEQQQQQRQTEVVPTLSIAATPPTASGSMASSSTKPSSSTQHSQSFPTIPTLVELHREKEAALDDDIVEKSSPPQQSHIKSFTSSPLFASDGRELQIEYWTSPLGYPFPSAPLTTQCHYFSPQDGGGHSNVANVGSKFSMKASVRTLSIAREPMSNLLSMLFVKERKKDKVLHKLGRRNKQKSTESSGVAFSSQSRVVSGVTRIVCTTSGIGGKKEAAMEVFIDGVAWRGVRFFQISAQWQTHVKLFPVSFPVELPASLKC
ncbi:hypothetical protein GPALN_012510 [Globodera pallida]|nr:hypothetical protein GPALN_012510 [Globodera pallida]